MGQDGGCCVLITIPSPVVLGEFSDKAQEGELADEEIGPLLVTTDFAEGNGPRAVAVGLLGALAFGSLGGGTSHGVKLLTRGLAPGGLAGSLLGTSHDYLFWSAVLLIGIGMEWRMAMVLWR